MMRGKHFSKVLLAGMGSGLFAAWAMNEFQAALSKASRIGKEDETKSTSPQSNPADDGPEDATMKAADRIVSIVLKKKLTRNEKKSVGQIVHYAFGASMGALYSMAAEVDPNVTRGFGTAFGAALFAAADEIAIPLFGFAKGPEEYPLSSHVAALAAHLVYGVSTEGVRRASRAIL